MFYLGAFLFVSGLSIRLITMKSLGQNITWRVQRPTHLVKTGIYKYIRHPLYLGGLMDYTGLALMLTGSLGISFMFLCFMFNYILDRIDREENFLATCYGQEYVEYFKKTWMLIPKVF